MGVEVGRIATNAINYVGVHQVNRAEFLAGEINPRWELSELHKILTMQVLFMRCLQDCPQHFGTYLYSIGKSTQTA